MHKEVSKGLELRGLSKFYDDQVAVDDVSLDVKPGQFLTLLGPSGSGKTTILMAIAGFVTPSEGGVYLSGKDITALPAEKRNFGMVFQGYALFPHMSVAENIGFPLKVRGLSRAEIQQKISAVLELVQLGHLSNRKPAELSGGQQQRIALARAMVFEPTLLLLDEPLSALDRKLRKELQVELKILHERTGMTFIYVTHDQEEALSMSDEIIVMNEGKITQQGTPQDIYERPNSRFVANFMGGSNFLQGQVIEDCDAYLRYQVADQEFRQDKPADGQSIGETVLVSISPEKMMISQDRPDDELNSIQGEISNFSYFGSTYHFFIDTDSIGSIDIITPAWSCAINPKAHQPVWISWSADASVLLSK